MLRVRLVIFVFTVAPAKAREISGGLGSASVTTLGVNLAAGGAKNVTSSTDFLADKRARLQTKSA